LSDVVGVSVGPRADGFEVGSLVRERCRSDRGPTGCGPRDGEPEASLDRKLAQVILPEPPCVGSCLTNFQTVLLTIEIIQKVQVLLRCLCLPNGARDEAPNYVV